MSTPADQLGKVRRVPVGVPSVYQLGMAPPVPAGTPTMPATPQPLAGATSLPADQTSVRDVQQVRAAGNDAAARGASARARMAAMPGAPATPPASTPASEIRFNPNPRTPTAMPGAPAPAVATPTPTPATAPAQVSAAQRLGQTVKPAVDAAGKAARFGASAVETVPGKIPLLRGTAAGQMGAAGAALALGGITGATTAAGTDTSDYSTRMGVEKPTGWVGDVAQRTAGVLSDVGAAIVDPVIELANAAGRGVKAVFPNAPEFLTRQAPTLRSRFADVQANPDTPSKPTAAQMLAGDTQPAASAPQASRERPADEPQRNPQPAGEPATGGDDVVGEINGRKITRAESDRLANQNVVPGGTAASKLAEAPRDNGPRFIMPKENGDRGTIEAIDKAISQLGPIDRRGRRDALVDLLGLRQKGVGGDLDRASLEGRNAADIAQRDAASQLGAEVDREQIAASTANARRQTTQTITDAQGNVYSVDGKTLTQMTKPDGTPLTAPTKQDTSLQDAAMKLLQDSAASGTPMDAATAAAQVQGVATAMQAAQAAPPGTTYAGTQNGVPVYRDAQGRLIQTNQQ